MMELQSGSEAMVDTCADSSESVQSDAPSECDA